MDKLCLNCGNNAHNKSLCKKPRTSYGVINFDIPHKPEYKKQFIKKYAGKNIIQYMIKSNMYPDIKHHFTNIEIPINSRKYYIDDAVYNTEIVNNSNLDIFHYYQDKLMFMMVSRKYSLGFVQFISGRYEPSDIFAIIYLFKQMYESEIIMIASKSFDDLLFYFLNRNNYGKCETLDYVYRGKYKNEYLKSKEKFTLLSGNPSDLMPLNLKFYTDIIKPTYPNAEWGFPKGRRNNDDYDNITCAEREFCEETGYHKTECKILDLISPIEEELIGTNGTTYRHVYYISADNCPDHHKKKEYDSFEIGKVAWFGYQQAMQIIRPYHNKKKEILTKTYLFLLNNLVKMTVESNHKSDY
jgi:8-oxo-dGTP pyrophosphatase MutT (NUDIX family)